MLTLGVNSGTSVDAIDMCLVEWNSKDLRKYKIIKEATFSFDDDLKKAIQKIINKQEGHLEDISNLNFKYSYFVAEKINEFKNGSDIDLIGMHGQTIFHGEESTWQIGDGSIVANVTDTITISDFRPADMSVGGHGAPLISFLDDTLVKNPKENTATLNIGGIANLSIMETGKETLAFDTGPGNILIDFLMSKLYQQDFDKDGEIAFKGRIDHSFIDEVITSHDYFEKEPPKTTGREFFNEKFADKFLDLGNKENIISTVSYFTVETISRELKKYPVSKVFVSGGGINNKFLMDNLKKANPEVSFLSHSELGINDQYKEALLFSLLAFTCQKKMHNNIPSSTGASNKAILGKISHASQN